MDVSLASDVAPGDEAELAAFVADSAAGRRALRVIGGGTRLPFSGDGVTLTTRALRGIVTYEPGELTLIARTGTPLDEIEATLAAQGQALAFEPMDHRVLLGGSGTPTIGGVVAANVCGPRRVQAGAARDHLLGVRFVDGQGRVIKNGGRVMKNVTGMDLGKLLAGSFGTLGVLTQVALKTLPVAESRLTLAFPDVSARQAVEIFCAALGTPCEVSGAAFLNGTAWLRIEGLAGQVAHRRDRLAALLRGRPVEVLDDAATRGLWRDLRDVRYFADVAGAVWRIVVKPTDAPAVLDALAPLGGRSSLDWGGGLIWHVGPGGADAVRRAVRQAAAAGHATLVRGDPAADGPVFQPQPAGVAALSAAMRRTFDPAGILNPGLMAG
ncbi:MULTISPECIES: glycolate oxidase subunit GlcE [Proteobacteria]|uniref:glycolate oxidase subunit GlcE n=1 Tax=Paracoccus marinus TaxID=288426 RepID=UPI00103D64FE|nr:glycolate oxidase [Paracoccus marinus]